MSVSRKSLKELFIYMLILILSYFQMNGNSTISIILSFLIIAMSLFSDLSETLEIMFICLPFFNILNSKMGTTSLYYLFVILFILKYLFLKGEKHYFKSKMIICGFVLILTSYNITVASKYLTWLILLVPFILSYGEKFLNKNFSRLITFYALSMVLSSAIGYMILNKGLSIYTSSYVYNNGSIHTRFSGLIGDSNVYSQSLLIIESLLIYNFMYLDKSKRNLLFILLLVVFGVLTYSKMNIVVTVFLIFIYVLKKMKMFITNKKHKYKFIIYLFMVGFILLCGLLYISKNTDSNIISSYITRFSASDLMTGRFEVYNHFISIWLDNPLKFLFGIGFKSYTTPFVLGNSYVQYAHNLYIETICLYGFIVFMGIVFSIFKLCQKSKGFLNKLPLIILLITGLILHGNMEFSFFMNLILIFECLSYNKEGVFDEKKQC